MTRAEAELQGYSLVGLFLVVGLTGFSGGVVNGLNIWPMPASVSPGRQSLVLSQDFKLKTQYSDDSGILVDGFSRLLQILQTAHVVHGNVSFINKSLLLQGLNVVISSTNEQLQYGIDESYKLSIPGPGKQTIYALLEAQTVYGALHGMQTFSQLCNFNFTTRIIEVNLVPWIIIDKPRFSYRGLLIDTSRHYLPLPVIKKVIDSMAYTKLNILHWHIVDSQSFPLEIPSYPKLWNGAYSVSERYTTEDAGEVVSYARRRGINVLAEIDVPGHALSWGTGYPSLWPSRNCHEPLDVSNEFTFKVIDGILSDFSKIFNFKFIHLGGDEVNTDCWTMTPHIRKWLQKHGMNESEAYQYFVLRAQNIALSHGYEIINWYECYICSTVVVSYLLSIISTHLSDYREETFNNFGNKLSRKTVVHNWYVFLALKFSVVYNLYLSPTPSLSYYDASIMKETRRRLFTLSHFLPIAFGLSYNKVEL